MKGLSCAGLAALAVCSACADDSAPMKAEGQGPYAVGLIAPDIVGQDLDGKEFKLSGYRGKVVVLDFWGNW